MSTISSHDTQATNEDPEKLKNEKNPTLQHREERERESQIIPKPLTEGQRIETKVDFFGLPFNFEHKKASMCNLYYVKLC